MQGIPTRIDRPEVFPRHVLPIEVDVLCRHGLLGQSVVQQ